MKINLNSASFETKFLVGSLIMFGAGLALQNLWLVLGGGGALAAACCMRWRVTRSTQAPAATTNAGTEAASISVAREPADHQRSGPALGTPRPTAAAGSSGAVARANRGPEATPASPQASFRRRKTPAVQPGITRTAAYVEQMIAQGRYALLLRPEVLRNLTEEQKQVATEILQDEMALVRAGEVQMATPHRDRYAGMDDLPEIARSESFYLDRFAVTHEEFQQFVDDGGYAQLEVWDESAEDAISHFVDRSGALGPRFWTDGRFPQNLADHPVVGISWFEAAAYARWCGKRLPSDTEWVRAAASPVRLGSGTVQQRRYPWGEVMDESRANLWLSGLGNTAPVTAFAGGDSVLGIRQLVGNVWEWTADPFGAWSLNRAWREAPIELKSLRGGAFNTYFESQAACCHPSGDHPLVRKNNIGFRCALSAEALAETVAGTPEEMAHSS